MKLKNPFTNQNVYNAMKQFKEDRDPKEKMLGKKIEDNPEFDKGEAKRAINKFVSIFIGRMLASSRFLIYR